MRFLFLALLLFIVAGCTGSGAVNPLTPQKATESDGSMAAVSDVIYWTSAPVTFPLTDTLNGICMVSSKAGWICGNNGIILQYDGEAWSKVQIGFSQTENFMGVGFADQNNGWVVGTHGTILSYKNGTWSPFPSPTQQDLYAISVLRSQNAWAVGANGTLLRYNGVSWGVVSVSSPTPGAGNVALTGNLNDISMSDENNGWAVGDQGTILRYEGQVWTTFPSSPSTEKLNSVSAVDNLQAWIVGAYGTILSFNGTTWNSMGTAFSGFDLYQVFMRSSADGWAVGQNGTILYYDGARWIPHPKPDNKPNLNALSFAGDTAFAVGQAGAILKFQSGGESPKFSFLFKGAFAKPTGPFKPWNLTYTIMNQSLKASPDITFELSIPKGFKIYQEPTMTPVPTVVTTAAPTVTPVVTSGLTAASTPGAVTAPGGFSTALTTGWKLDGDKIHWDLGVIASSELKTLSLPFEKTKDFNPKTPAIFNATLKFSDQTVAQAGPVTMWQGLATLATIPKAIPTAVPVVSPTATPTVSSGS
jgi:photosystem II stability/assembly factor-like uncharacterized protein